MIKLLVLNILICSTSCQKYTNKNFEDELAYPINLNVSFNEETESATLTWDRVEGADGYTVWYSYSETENYTLLADVTQTKYTDSSIKRNTKKYYKIKSYNTYTVSILSVPISVFNPLLEEPIIYNRAMWIWKSDSALMAEPRVRLLNFCEIHEITTVYLNTGRNDYSADPTLKDNTKLFIKQAHAQGIEVHGLTGAPNWILPEHHYIYLGAVSGIIAYNQTVADNEKFDGYQSDVEPNRYITGSLAPPSIPERLQNIVNYLDLHKAGRDLIDAAVMSGFKYGIAISAFYDTWGSEYNATWNGNTQPMLDHLFSFVDYLAVMSYRDSSDGIISLSSGEVDKARDNGKLAWVSVETNATHLEGKGSEGVNFFDEGIDFMEEEIEKVKLHYSENEGFGGIAVHAYRRYAELINKGNN